MGPRISKLNSWSRSEVEILDVLEVALDKIMKMNSSEVMEVKINCQLQREIRKIIAARRLPYTTYPPDSPNQPDLFEGDSDRDRKKPDIQVGLINSNAIRDEDYQREYVIECKRIGLPSNGRNLNSEYVHKGLKRFLSKEFGYAKGVNSGAMVGYLQSCDFPNVFDEINSILSKEAITIILSPRTPWMAKGISRMDQLLNRPEVEPVSFTLNHLWADLRQAGDINVSA